MASPLKTLLWRFGYAWRRVGWRLPASAALFATAGLLYWQAATLQSEHVRLRKILAQPPSKPEPLSAGTDMVELQRRLDEFYAGLPEQGDLPGEVRKLFAAAEKLGVRLAQGDYRATSDSGAHLIRYQITLPVRGEAARVQAFALDALSASPMLGLEGASFKRESPQTAETEARLRFMLLARQP